MAIDKIKSDYDVQRTRFIFRQNARVISLPLGLTPGSGWFGGALVVNANQGILSVVRFDTNIGVSNYGTKSLTASMNETNLEIKASDDSTIWGMTFLIVYANFVMPNVV